MYCYDCRSRVRSASTHPSTARHRRATRPAEYRRGSGDWLRPRHYAGADWYADPGTPAQNRAAARHLGIIE